MSAPTALEVRRPRWLAPTSLVLALLGTAVSAYLTYEHFTENRSLVCTNFAATDCLKVTTSVWSKLFGMPVSLLGLVFYVVMLVLCLPRVWRMPSRALDMVRLLALVGGLGMVLYLVWAEVVKIHSICLWCTVVHVVTFVLLLVVLFGQILSDRVPVRGDANPVTD